MSSLKEEDKKNIAWMDEKVERLPKTNGLYKLLCLILGRKKLSYSELYLLVAHLAKEKLGEKEAKEQALNSVIELYKENNGHLPDGIEEN